MLARSEAHGREVGARGISQLSACSKKASMRYTLIIREAAQSGIAKIATLLRWRTFLEERQRAREILGDALKFTRPV
jgi:hypothetical protein